MVSALIRINVISARYLAFSVATESDLLSTLAQRCYRK